MQLSLSQLEVLKPTNWSPKCRRNTLIGAASMVALVAIGFLASSQARAWLRCQFMTESLACKKLKTAIKNDDPVTAKAILNVFSNSEKIKEYLKSPNNEDGNTVLHVAMFLMDKSNEWKEVAEALLAKPYALELLQVKNNQGESPWFYVKYNPESILLLTQMPELSEEAWKTPIDKDENTVLHRAMFLMDSSDEWKEVAEALLEKPFAVELLQVKNNQEESPWYNLKYDTKAILLLAKMPELSADVWKTPIDEEGNTVLHRTMSMMSRSDEWKEVAEALLAKSYAAELLQVQNKDGESPWFYVDHDSKAILLLTQMHDLPLEVWKSPIDEEGNTVLHQAIIFMECNDEWKTVANALLKKPFAVELLQVQNKNGESPWYNLRYDTKSILLLAKMPELSAELWKTPIDKDENTVLHVAMWKMDISDEWKEVAEALLAKPYADELKLIKNNAGEVPSAISKSIRSRFGTVGSQAKAKEEQPPPTF